MSSERVLLHVYDLSNGMVKNFTHLLGKEFEGIWHTGIVVYGREYFFGGGYNSFCRSLVFSCLMLTNWTV
jgi:hypothetical protein